MNYRKIIYSVFVSLIFTTAIGQNVSQEAALEKAINFFNDNQAIKTRALEQLSSAVYQLVYTAKQDDEVCYYVYNRGNNQGFIIVSADERTANEILGYSTTGSFDYENMPENAKAWVEGYAKDIKKIKETGIVQQKNIKTRATTTYKDEVYPLLGETEWDQCAPFNDLCPVIDGIKCPTGCGATAMAQVMYYHKWPEQGHGNITYTSYIGNTYSADFNHSYDWDAMKPKYSGREDEAARNAVALLMHDCGYSSKMNYSPGESSTFIENMAQALADYFDYDKDIHQMYIYHSSHEKLENTIYGELSELRPIIVDGDTEEGGRHAFIIDGYDKNKFVHINYGWGGISNGFYSIYNTGFDNDTRIVYGIRKNEGNPAGYDFYVFSEFIWDNINGKDVAKLHAYFRHLIEDTCTFKLAFAYKNIDTNDIYYKEKYEVKECDRCDFGAGYSFPLDKIKEEGNYIIYPVFSVDGGQWNKLDFPDASQKEIKLTIKNGINQYTNNPFTNIALGRLEKDGIFYNIDKNKYEAEVTFKNSHYKSYIEKKIIIPSIVTYDNIKYNVTKIGDHAFKYCSLLSDINIPNSINSIGAEAFWNCSFMKSIKIPDSVNSIGKKAFYACDKINNIIFPTNINIIEESVFEWCISLNSVTIPKNVNKIKRRAFFDSPVKDIYVKTIIPPLFEDSEFGSRSAAINSSPNIHVYPEALAAFQASDWAQYGTIVGDLNSSDLSISVVEQNMTTNEDCYDLFGNKVKELEGKIIIKNGKKIILQ